jgi:hypothetical protein
MLNYDRNHMKNVLFLAFMLINTVSFAQPRKIRELGDLKIGEYNSNIGLKKYIGMWQGKYGEYAITINLRYAQKVQIGTAPNVLYYDRLEGDYIVKKGAQEIVNTTNKRLTSTTPYCVGIENSSGLFLYIYPENKANSFKMTIKRVDARTLQLTKNLADTPLFGGKKEPAFVLPDNLILKRINQ